MQEKYRQENTWRTPSQNDLVFLGVAALTGAIVAFLGGRGIRAVLETLIRK